MQGRLRQFGGRMTLAARRGKQQAFRSSVNKEKQALRLGKACSRNAFVI
jgi:hypothetical protein